MTLRYHLECDTCHVILKPIISTAPIAVYAEAKLQGWGFFKNAFGLRVDICPMCQIDDIEEDKDMGHAINDLLNGESKNDSSSPR